jgi:hypothetical protein
MTKTASPNPTLILVDNKAFGDKTHGESQSDEIGTNALEFIICREPRLINIYNVFDIFCMVNCFELTVFTCV